MSNDGSISRERESVVNVIPAGMTGNKYRKYKGIGKLGVFPRYCVSAKFENVKAKGRLAFLRKMSSGASATVIGTRDSDVSGQRCYCCLKAAARVLHHVTPLAHGGRKRRNNMVPLCPNCHALVNPPSRGSKEMHDLKGAVASRHSVQPIN